MSKSVKIKLPEIEVSDDVNCVHITCYEGGDEYGNVHNTAGLAMIRYQRIRESSDWHIEKGYFIKGKHCFVNEFNLLTKPKEMTVKEIEELLGHKVKIVG